MSSASTNADLRPLSITELVVGRPLPGAIRDDSGRVLIPPGESLTERHVELLRERNQGELYVGSDWPPPRQVGDDETATASPDEIMKALRRRNRSKATSGKHRRHARHSWNVPLRLTIELRGKRLYCRRELNVRTHDISVSGYSFTCEPYVYPGTIVFARFEMLPNKPIMKGIVRNCLLVKAPEHRVGVEFVSLEPGENVPFI